MRKYTLDVRPIERRFAGEIRQGSRVRLHADVPMGDGIARFDYLTVEVTSFRDDGFVGKVLDCADWFTLETGIGRGDAIGFRRDQVQAIEA